MTSIGRAAGAGLELGDVLGLELIDALEGGDRHLDLIERGLARGQPLQPEPGREQCRQHATAPVLAGEADQLVGDPGDRRAA